VNHPSRTRLAPGSRALAIWLIIAQLTLFGADGLTHRHAGAGAAPAVASGQAAVALHGARLTELRAARHSGSPDCAICQAVRGAVVSLACAPGVLLCTTLCGSAPAALPPAPSPRLTDLCSTRGPPTL
jgi:hypothetical protein